MGTSGASRLGYVVFVTCSFGCGADVPDGEGSVIGVRKSALVVSEQAKLAASDGATNDDFSRSSVGLFGDTALIGARGAAVGAKQDQGAAYVHVRVGAAWWLQQKLTAADGALGDGFGNAVALGPDTALVGASFDTIGAAQYQGSAYVFVRSGTTWSQQQKLTASDGAMGGMLGYAVSISGDTALVGAMGDLSAKGAAYVFTRSGATWSQQQKLTAADGEASDWFGGAVAVAGDTALVAAYGDDVGANANQGSVYVFTRSGSTWSQQQKLTAADGAALDDFGFRVALAGDTALIGAMSADVGGTANQGAAYVFSRSGGVWSQLQKLVASDGATNDFFGRSLGIVGDVAAVGAYLDDVGGNQDRGSVYVFAQSGGTWKQQTQLTASDGAANDYFGESLAFDGSTLVAGAFGDDLGAISNSGAAYVFAVKKANGDPCAATTECSSGYCIDGVCCASACAGGLGDCTACSVAMGAAADGTCGPTTGNPCAGGTCQAGACQPSGSGGSGGGMSTGGQGGDAASAGGAPNGGTPGTGGSPSGGAPSGGAPSGGAPSGGQGGAGPDGGEGGASSDEGGCQCGAVGAGDAPLALHGPALALLGLIGLSRRKRLRP